MIVRSISQLPSINQAELNSAAKKSYVEVSYCTTQSGIQQYLSRKATAYDFSLIAAQDLSTKMVYDYSMNSNGKKIQLSSEQKRIDDLYYSDITVSGIKNFRNFPMISVDFPSEYSRYGRVVDYIIPNVLKVKDLVSSSPVFVSTTSSYVADGNPFKNVNGRELSDASQLRYDETIGQGQNKFYMWKLDSTTHDSSRTDYSSYTYVKDAYEEVRDDGQLVIWGWLADTGDVSPEQAWVGLFTIMKTEGNSNSMVQIPLQIQPWVRGSNSSKLQYVGFNIAVKKGTKLLIKTGFQLNEQGGDYKNPGTMTFIDTFIPNCFFGYIIKN